jgi:hypothetical protein
MHQFLESLEWPSAWGTASTKYCRAEMPKFSNICCMFRQSVLQCLSLSSSFYVSWQFCLCQCLSTEVELLYLEAPIQLQSFENPPQYLYRDDRVIQEVSCLTFFNIICGPPLAILRIGLLRTRFSIGRHRAGRMFGRSFPGSFDPSVHPDDKGGSDYIQLGRPNSHNANQNGSVPHMPIP